MRSRTWVVVVVVAAVLSTCACACACAPPAERSRSAAEAAPPPWRAQMAAWRYPAPLPAFPLVDERGRAFSLDARKGAPLVVGFVFTRCPVADACPLTMARLKQVHERAPALRILVVTLDPAHDTPPVLAAYAQRFGVAGDDAFTLATAPREVVDALGSLFNVVAIRRGDGDIAHPVKVALLDDKLAPAREWLDNNFTADEVIDASARQ